MQYALASIIGRGASGLVYHATKIEGSGRGFAVKNSRTPLCFNRSRLQHEGRVLQLLQGHPYILPVLAYGRFQHFEFLSIELLGAALDDLYTDLLPAPIQTMFVVADQMLSALEFVHSHQIVHRDVKPGNIMVSLDDPPRLKLIDFGMSRHFQTGVPKRIDLYTEVKHLAGTINYASLNSHDGIELSRRDDLESLFYSVFSLLRGSLPWKHVVSQFYYTTLGEMRHVHEFKKVWSGAMLAEGHPEELGRILDLVRRLTFDEDPDYLGYRCILESLRERLGLGHEEKLKWPINLKDNPPVYTQPVAPPCVLSVGQLVYAQILMGPSIQGYGAHGDDPAVWVDPTYATEEWQAPPRPAIVAKTGLCPDGHHHEITVLPLVKREPAGIPSIALGQIPQDQMTERGEPRWPSELPAYCYVFDKPCKLVAVETESVPYHWSLSSEQVEKLMEKLPPNQHPMDEDDTKASKRFDNDSYYHIYSAFTPLQPDTLDFTVSNTKVEWHGGRGWFDELVKVCNIRAREDGWVFGENVYQKNDDDLGSHSNSYWGADLTQWDDMDPRDRSITLPHEEEEHLDANIPLITKIVEPDGTVRIN